ncbi:hypothetical protein TNCT_336311 [Trichonephila clavata]|uniref:GATA-type domain-containing protein n=1 Tax=Trichonephila clavata TaxID=2740835 RepID=A0A8X6FJL5_TRICU|nr:hypothetical protein TNCT_336311 [Trichonephila clavata]
MRFKLLFSDEVIKFVATVKPRRLLCGGEVKMANSFVTLVACTTNCTIEIVRRKCVRIPSRPEIATNQKMLIAKRRVTTAHLKLFLLVLQALLSPSCALSRRSDQICCNCKTQKTSLWRRSQNGEFICNPCGLYYKLHNRDRRRKCVRIPSRPEIATNQKILIAKRRATTAHLKLFLLVLQALLSPSCVSLKLLIT